MVKGASFQMSVVDTSKAATEAMHCFDGVML
jgi:hypothetical protein